MNLKFSTCLVAVGLSLGLLAGCSSFESPTKANAKGVWELGSLVGETPGKFRIFRGNNRATIVGMLGEPKYKKTTGADGTTEEWTYVRLVEFGYELKGASSGISLQQRAHWVETSRIIFLGDAVQSVATSRVPHINGPGRPTY